MDVSGTQMRAVRAALFTALVVTLSSASHVLLSRVPLPMTAVALLAGAVFAVAFALAGRERGFGAIAGLLVPLELAADTVFTTGQHLCYGAAGGPIAGPLRSVGVDVLCGDGAGADGLSGVAAVGTPLAGVTAEPHHAAALLASPGPAVPWLLLVAHVTVGLLAAAWLRRGESALAGRLRAAAAVAFRPLLVAVAVAGGARRGVRSGARRTGRPHPLAPARFLVHSVGRRGPPRSAFTPA
ncbi:membrane protein [Streptomyces sp. NRRL S-15]|uniref:membrane protein n=1 Tax=Streptomyces sp. NRRL S-15 TaxID=1463886 RepID=UPI0004C88A71|nr:membrane protein [Streptomyces sp. NRRL S-15]